MTTRLAGAVLLLLCSVPIASAQRAPVVLPETPPSPPATLIVTPEAAAQAVPIAAPEAPPTPPVQNGQLPWMAEYQCPGGFPSDLTQQNCSYTQRQRTVDWVSTSFTDQAMLTSAAASLMGFALASPPTTWPRTTLGYARDWRASYFSGMANGTTQYVFNALLRFNPEHVSCSTDAFIKEELASEDSAVTKKDAARVAADVNDACTWNRRVLHVLLDTVATRRSTLDGRGRLFWPSPRLAGAFAGAYSESPWEPPFGNTRSAILTRAGESLIVPAIGSVLNEYPTLIQDITKVLHLHSNKSLPKRTAEEVQ
jgi:hypothetical protein